MEALLKSQLRKTLKHWLEDKGLSTKDPVQDIIDYYAYLDVLHKPNPTSPEVFSVDDLLLHISTWCKSYDILAMRLVSKEWSRVLPVVRKSSSYIVDNVLDWYHISKALGNSGFNLRWEARNKAIEMGYLLDLSFGYPSHIELCIRISRTKKETHRINDLFSHHISSIKWNYSNASDLNKIIANCVKRGNKLLFKTVFDALLPDYIGSGLVGILSRERLFAAYNGMVYDLFSQEVVFTRPEHMSRMVDEWLEVSDVLFTAAYCGGNYDKMVIDFNKCFIGGYVPLPLSQVSFLLGTVHFGETLKLKEISLVTPLLERGTFAYTYKHLVRILVNTEWTEQELKDFWPTVVDKMKDTLDYESIDLISTDPKAIPLLSFLIDSKLLVLTDDDIDYLVEDMMCDAPPNMREFVDKISRQRVNDVH